MEEVNKMDKEIITKSEKKERKERIKPEPLQICFILSFLSFFSDLVIMNKTRTFTNMF